MKLLHVILERPIIWSIHPNDSDLFELNCLPGWKLVNPLLNNKISDDCSNPISESGSKVTFIVDENILLYSTHFYLAMKDNAHFEWTIESSLGWEKKLFMLVKHFRYTSKQFSISPKNTSFGPVDIKELPVLDYPNKVEEVFVQAWHIHNAIDKNGIEFVSKQSLTEPPPQFDSMLLDAIEALTHEDYQTTVLFSAIAMENLIRIKSESIKDHNSFATLLEKASLTIMGKSLSVDNKKLYDAACEIYKKRNQIVHRGSIPNKEHTRLSGIRDAITAVKVATQLVEWFGEVGGYRFPFDDANGPVLCYNAKYENTKDAL
jgi:hypothetical protein